MWLRGACIRQQELRELTGEITLMLVVMVNIVPVVQIVSTVLLLLVGVVLLLMTTLRWQQSPRTNFGHLIGGGQRKRSRRASNGAELGAIDYNGVGGHDYDRDYDDEETSTDSGCNSNTMQRKLSMVLEKANETVRQMVQDSNGCNNGYPSGNPIGRISFSSNNMYKNRV